MTALHPSCQAVNDILAAAGLPGRVRILGDAAPTARAAAEQLGCPVGAIANSLIFAVRPSNRPDEGGLGSTEPGRRERLGSQRSSGASAPGREATPRGREATETPLLIMTSGAHRVDVVKVGLELGTNLRRASADFVREHTGQPIGGVAPIGHPRPIRTLIDVALAEFDELWAAGGIPHAVFPISYPELLALTKATEITVSD